MYLFLNLFIFNQRIIALKYWFGFCHTLTWISHRFAWTSCILLQPSCKLLATSWTSFPPPTPSHPSRLSWSTSLSSLCHIANSHWLFVLHMVMNMFSCYALNLSHPFHPLLCPQDCFLCLRIDCCPVNRFIGTIFIDSIYIRQLDQKVGRRPKQIFIQRRHTDG